MIDIPKNYLPLIKESLYRHPGISRTQLAGLLGIKAPSIVPYITNLMEEGIIQEIKAEKDDTKKSAGRRQMKLEIVADAGFVVGVELGPYATYLAIADLRGTVIYKESFRKITEPYEVSIPFISEIIVSSITKAAVEKDKILGISIGIPGHVEKERGRIVVFPDAPEWKGRNLASDLEALIGLPVTIENNTRARAEAAGLLLTPVDITYFAYLFVSRGIACPIMVNGHDISLRTAGAGELGYTIVDYSALKDEGDNTDGRLISESSELSIIRQCRTTMIEHPSCLLNAIAGAPENLEMSHVLTAFEENDVFVREIMEKAVMYLGYVMGNLINVINPERIYVDAYIMKSDKIKKILSSYIHRSLKRLSSEEISLCFLDFSPYRGAVGSCADALITFFVKRTK